MRKQLLFVFDLFSKSKIDKVKYEIEYSTGALEVPHRGVKSQDIKVLQIGDSVSRFYSVWENKIQKKRDSLRQKGYSPDQIRGMIGGMRRSYDHSIVYKNYPSTGSITVVDNIGKFFSYEERLLVPVWQIENEHKSILGYKCQKAISKYKGRTWIAWFTPEIPISEGPWKLYGLPGLILQADDEKNEFNFLCEGIKDKSDQNEYYGFFEKKSVKTTRADFLALQKVSYLEPNKTMSKIMGVEIKDMSPTKQERSYNPIEF